MVVFSYCSSWGHVLVHFFFRPHAIEEALRKDLRLAEKGTESTKKGEGEKQHKEKFSPLPFELIINAAQWEKRKYRTGTPFTGRRLSISGSRRGALKLFENSYVIVLTCEKIWLTCEQVCVEGWSSKMNEAFAISSKFVIVHRLNSSGFPRTSKFACDFWALRTPA